MDEIVDSEQLAELESFLYSQIHHSVDTEPNPAEMSSDAPKANQNSFGPPRYFIQTQPNVVTQIPPAFANASVANPPPIQNQPPAASDNVQRFQIQQPIQIKLPQFYQPPVNNIVFMAPNIPSIPPITSLSKNQRKKLNKQLRIDHSKTLQDAINDAEVFRLLNQEDRSKVIKLQKRQRYLTRRKEKQKLLKEQKLVEKYNETITTDTASNEDQLIKAKTVLQMKPMITEEVIELSETDEDEVITLDQSYDTVVLSSDDDTTENPTKTINKQTKTEEEEKPTPSVINESDDGSVQFVPTPVAEPIVVEAGEEQALELEPVAGPSKAKTDAELMKPPSDTTDTTSLSSAESSALLSDKPAPITPTRTRLALSRSRTELLNTPESSNDFLDNSLDVSDQNFNFSLHGGDLVAEKTFLAPRSLAETFESESSCSASDISSVKNPVFNELEFDSPAKQLFGEADLGSFSDFITPKRKSAGIPSLLSPGDVIRAPSPKASKTSQIHDDSNSGSDSSSESELEDEGFKSKTTTRRKRLPSLSHFDIDETQARSTPISKGAKNNKVVKAQNKFDFIKDAVEEEAKQDQVEVATPKGEKKNNNNKKGKKKTDEKLDKVDEDIDTTKAFAKRKRKRKKKLSITTEENVLEEKTGEEPLDVDVTKASKKRKQKLGENVEQKSEAEVTDMASSGKKRKRQKSKSDNEAETATTKGSKKKTTKSDSEVDDVNNEKNKKSKRKANKADNVLVTNENDKLEEIQIEGVVTETVSPSKRKKRRSRSDSNPVEVAPVLESQEADKQITEDTEESEENDLDNTNTSDIQIIEIPPVCIDLLDELSDIDTDDEMHFGGDELAKLKTDLDLPNVKANSPKETNTSWEIEAASPTAPIPIAQHGSWCAPGFDADAVWKSLPDDPGRWKIMERDRIHIRMDSHGPRCKRCREVGHYALNCPKGKPACFLCADKGHQEPRCPNTRCTNCGRATRFLTANCGCARSMAHKRCSVCDRKGHSSTLCPDGWRRYHLTTKVGKIIAPQTMQTKYGKDRWCSGCARSGHFEYQCDYYNRTHPSSSPFIYKYVDIYKMSTETEPMPKEKSNNIESMESRVILDTESEALAPRQVDQDPDAVAHKQIVVSETLPRSVYQLLETERGKAFLKSLLGDLDIFHSFEVKETEVVLNCRGFPTDLHRVGPVLKDFIQHPSKRLREITLSHTFWNRLQNKLPLLKQLDSGFSQHSIDHASRTVTFKGEVFGTILAKFNLMHAICANRNLPKVTKGKNDIQRSFKLQKDLIEDIRSHKNMPQLAKNYSLQWTITNQRLKLVGPKEKLEQFTADFVDSEPGNAPLRCSYDLRRKAAELIRFASHSKKSTLKLRNLLKSSQFQILNVYFVGEPSFPSKQEFEVLKTSAAVLEQNVFIKKQAYDLFLACVKDFTKARSKKCYSIVIEGTDIDRQKKLQEESALKACSVEDLYSFGEPVETPHEMEYFIDLQHVHAKHLLESQQGIDFLNELSFNFRIDLKGDKLCLHCNESQKDKAVKQINFYFLILDMTFPKYADVIHKKLLRCMSNVKLDYYISSCRELYDGLRLGGRTHGWEELHALLFAKYEFLDARNHIETVRHYIQFLPQLGKSALNIRDYRHIKTAALYLFCPIPMDVDYDLLISLAAPPIILRSQSTHSAILDAVKSTMYLAREASRYDALKTSELDVLQKYLTSTDYSLESLEIAKLFLSENFPKQRQ